MLRSFRHRNFRLFFIGQLISLSGTWMQTMAQSWLIYRLTQSPTLLGLAGFAGQIPVLLAAPLGGVAADRMSRKKILVIAHALSLVQALVLTILTLGHWVQVWHVLVLLVVIGLINGFEIPARQSFAVEMVGKEDLPNAIALNSSLYNATRIIGPAIGGVIVAWVGEGWCFAFNAFSYLAVIVSLMMMNVQERDAPTPAASAWEHVAEGFRYVTSHPQIRIVLLLMAASCFLGVPYMVLLPIFAEEILHSGSQGFGLLMGSTGVGALLGALTLTALDSTHDLGKWIGWGCAGFGLSLIAFSLSHSLWISTVLLMPVGYLLVIQMAASNTLIQSLVADRLRGRVMAVYAMTFMGAAPIGSLIAGWIAKSQGSPRTVLYCGMACVASAALTWNRLPVRGRRRYTESVIQ